MPYLPIEQLEIESKEYITQWSPPIIPKDAIARWRTARVIISLTRLPITNHSEADRRR